MKKTSFAHCHLAIALSVVLGPLSSTAATRDPADWWPNAEGLRSMAEYFPSETVGKGLTVDELEWGRPLEQSGPGGIDLDAFNRENQSTGMIVLHRGKIVYEGYWQGGDASSHFTSMSMAKSVTGTLIGIAEGEGLIRSIQDPIVRYVPELAETAYRDVTIEQALQMSSGVRYDNQIGPTSDEVQLTCLMLPPGPVFADCDGVRKAFGDVRGYLLSLNDRAAEPGTEFNYSTADAQVLGWVLRNATGRSPAEYLAEKLWEPLGMEDEAEWLVDLSGTTLTGASLNARLRDYARFGLLMLNDGVHDGKRLLPEGWVERATTPGAPHLQNIAPLTSYSYQWWVLPDGSFGAQGSQGQFLHIDPAHELVIAKTSAWAGSWNVEKALEFLAVTESVVKALGYE